MPFSSYDPPSETDDDPQISPTSTRSDTVVSFEVQNTIDSTIQELDPDLRQLSLDIWGKSLIFFLYVL